jgi:hypothetical protein
MLTNSNLLIIETKTKLTLIHLQEERHFSIKGLSSSRKASDLAQ